MSNNGVNRCVCYNLSFLLILQIAKEKNLQTIEEIKKEENICNKCRLCNKYIEAALKTGEFEFKLL